MKTYVTFLGKQWPVTIWDGKTDPAISPWVSLDTETEPFVHGQPLKPVILQVFCPTTSAVTIAPWQMMGEYLTRLANRNPNITYVWHSFPFDYRVLGHRDNRELTDVLVDEFHAMIHGLCQQNIDAMATLAGKRDLTEEETARLRELDNQMENIPKPVPPQGRIVDVALRYLLNQLRNGELAEDFRLETIAFKKLGFRLDKDESLRLSFRQDQPLTTEQIKYAALDAIATGLIYETLPDYEATETIQLFGDLSLSDYSWRGMFVDVDEDKRLRKLLTDRKDLAEKTLNVFGYYDGESGNQAVLQEALRNVERRCGIRLPRTDKKFDRYGRKQISLSKKAVGLFPEKGVHPLVTAYKDFCYNSKILSVYLGEQYVKEDGAVHTRFEPIKKTGRTGSKNPPMQNLPRGDGIRRRYKARPGKLLIATDASQVELCTLGATCYRRYGHSAMLSKINAGIGLHDTVATEIAKISSKLPQGVDTRTLAKSLNFGLPGGLGPETWLEFAATQYGVIVPREMFEPLKELWLSTFPEIREYLQGIVDPSHPGQYLAVTTTGRIRSNASFCSALNNPFQGLAADGGKVFMAFAFMSSCELNPRYSDRLRKLGVIPFPPDVTEMEGVAWIHDEEIDEFSLDKDVPAYLHWKEQTMVRGYRQVLPDCTGFKVESALMINWDKKAKEVYDITGRLVIWTKDIQSLKKDDPLTAALLQMSHAELLANCPDGYRPLFSDKKAKKFHGWQPLSSVVEWGRK